MLVLAIPVTSGLPQAPGGPPEVTKLLCLFCVFVRLFATACCCCSSCFCSPDELERCDTP